MFLVIIKFIEVFTRAGFVVGISYTLGLAQAGQFGIIVTLTGLVSFALGFERHVDIQRRLIGAPVPVFDRAYRDAIGLFGINYTVFLPIYVIGLVLWAQISPWQAALCVLIVIAEQLSNQVYQLALVAARFRSAIGIVVARNAVLLAWLITLLVVNPSRITLQSTIEIWAATAAALIAGLAIVWLRLNRAAQNRRTVTFATLIINQYRASLNHFLIGLVAILILQGDRLLVGALLPLSDVGVYFRHVLLVSIAYQVFNIAFYNRVLPSIFAQAQQEPKAKLARIVQREFLMLAALVVLGIAVMVIFDRSGGRPLLVRYSVDIGLVTVLMAGVVIRVAADFNAMILNARLSETMVLRAQLASFVVGTAMLAALTWQFNIYGAAAATVASAALYFLLSAQSLRALPDLPDLPESPTS